MTYRWRDSRSSNELLAAIIFAGFLAGFIFYLCLGNYQRAKRAMDRQRNRRIELEEEKRALAYSPTNRGGGSVVGSTARRRINFHGNDAAYDSPRSGYSGTSSMYTDEKGLTVGVGGVTVEGNRSHMLLGGDHGNGGAQFAVPPQQGQVTQPPQDLLDDNNDGVNRYGAIQQTISQGEMSV
mmetsp:Transcript_19830/g.41766  ORF Transcript_19830/g.41766 Transcript_19830/m.41766 type:complete len:181 (-) Transcript_19830:441-983(-)|eukprot:CAMPEP_0183710898 /NCGR_PEP_ID=MMETSP0737-20130205/6518_1 /TAXON_ID=385413 /ORGANISM="Thalassiosira miniscula, Strain CCMP1093" /LENGTH=180 /DNA_ID=CAMNT_0025939269 /DNA_START=81 /DNA_END=623 /DNA_ORIENTATION=-